MVDPRDEFVDEEWFPLNLVKTFCVDQECSSDQQPDVAGVQLGDEDFFVPLDDVAEVARERVQITQMSVRHRLTFGDGLLHRGPDGAEGSAPTDNKELAR